MPEIYPFTDDHVAYYCRRAAQNAEIKTIHAELQDRSICGCEPYTGSYERFLKRVNKIRPEQIESYRINAVATPQQQLAFLSKLVSEGKDNPVAKIRAIELIRDIQAQLDAEDPTKASKDGRTLITNPFNLKLDARLMAEMIMTFRMEMGGLDKLDLSVLNLAEIDALLKVLIQQKAVKQETNPEDVLKQMAADDSLDKYETRSQFISRLRREIQTLTEEEIAELEHDNVVAEREADSVNREAQEIAYRKRQADSERDHGNE